MFQYKRGCGGMWIQGWDRVGGRVPKGENQCVCLRCQSRDTVSRVHPGKKCDAGKEAAPFFFPEALRCFIYQRVAKQAVCLTRQQRQPAAEISACFFLAAPPTH